MAPRIDKPQRRVKKVAAKWPHTRGDDFRLGIAHVPTPELRNKVRTLAAMGALQTDIALVLRIDGTTLRKHYRQELDTAKIEANAQVAGKLYSNAMGGNVIAQIFWLKAQAGWVDRREVNHNHNIGPMMSHEERLEMLGSDPDDAPRQLVDGTAEEVLGPDDEDGAAGDGGARDVIDGEFDDDQDDEAA